MAGSDNRSDEPPSAWVWSQYRGEFPHHSSPAPTPAAPPARASDPPLPEGARSSGAIGFGLAGAVLAIAGLTYLFTRPPASESGPTPAPAENAAPAPTAAPTPAAPETPAAPAESQTTPAPAAPDAAPAKEPPKAATPSPTPEPAKKKKKKRD